MDTTENITTPSQPEALFRLSKSETRPLTPEMVQDWLRLSPSPTERVVSPSRIKYLREQALTKRLISFQWASADLQGERFRMNGQHSSIMLNDLNGQFPTDLTVHIDHYSVKDREGLALLFRQFDARKSSRTPTDVSGAYQGIYADLKDVPRSTAKLGAESIAWYLRHAVGHPAPTGDDVYAYFGEARWKPFLHWLGGLISIKTPELKRHPVVAAMIGTFEANEAVARDFWADVARGGVEFDDNAPATLLDNWLKAATEDKRLRANLKPLNYFQACVYAWNAARESKTVTSIKFDTKKGLAAISH